MARPKKLIGPERRLVAQRYETHRRNRIKTICRQHGISSSTLQECVREFRGRI